MAAMRDGLRVGDRVTVTNPLPEHQNLEGMRGTVTYFPGAGVLVSFDDGDEELLWTGELSGPHTDTTADRHADRILARLR